MPYSPPPNTSQIFMIVADETFDRALITELCSGRQFMEMMHKDRVTDTLAAAEAQITDKAKTHPTLGKVAGYVPADDYFRILNAQGEEFWSDRSAVKHYFKTNPQNKVASL